MSADTYRRLGGRCIAELRSSCPGALISPERCRIVCHWAREKCDLVTRNYIDQPRSAVPGSRGHSWSRGDNRLGIYIDSIHLAPRTTSYLTIKRIYRSTYPDLLPLLSSLPAKMSAGPSPLASVDSTNPLHRPSRNLVLCFDGTSNEYSDNVSHLQQGTNFD